MLAWLRQLLLDTLVAAVDTLRAEPLLYRVNALVDVPALDIELRQLLDAIELALDASGRPLRVLVGDTPRRSFSAPYPRRSALWCGLANAPDEAAPQVPLPLELVYGEGF